MPYFLLALALLFNLGAAAQPAPAYPTKAVRIVVPYGPGGATDIVARILSDHLRETLGQPFVVENKAGGNGVVALQEVARAKPDGYTLLIGNVTTQMLNPLIEGSKMPVNAFRDIVPIARLVDIPGVFLATKVNFPPNSVKEVVDYAKSHPGEVNYNSAGYLAYSHIDFLMLQKKTNIKMTLIPLKAGAGGGQIDLMNGEVHIGLQNAATVIPLVKGGKLKALAVTSDKRLAELPDVPTMKEAGFGDIGTNAWQAMYAPAGTPKEILDKLLEATLKALGDEKVQAQLDKLQFTLIPTKSLSEVQEWMNREVEVWTPIVKDAKEMADKQG
jgi:tripartite-type tricarboxylate transporter receptor subunit TctC